MMYRQKYRYLNQPRPMNKESNHHKYESASYWTQLIQLSLFDMIKSYLSSEGITKKEFADRLGVNKSYVTQILNGDFDHRLSKMVQLGLACGMVPKIEFAPISDAADILQTTYLGPKKWEYSGKYTGVVSIRRENPFHKSTTYCAGQKFEGGNTEWEESNTDTRIA